MTAPVRPRYCEHCKQTVTPKVLRTSIPGTSAVEISLCKCDYLTCANCQTTIYDRKAQRCASCGKDPAIKRQ